MELEEMMDVVVPKTRVDYWLPWEIGFLNWLGDVKEVQTSERLEEGAYRLAWGTEITILGFTFFFEKRVEVYDKTVRMTRE